MTKTIQLFMRDVMLIISDCDGQLMARLDGWDMGGLGTVLAKNDMCIVVKWPRHTTWVSVMDTQHYCPARTEVFQIKQHSEREYLISTIGAAKNLLEDYPVSDVIARKSLQNHVAKLEQELEEMERKPEGSNVYPVLRLIDWENSRKPKKE